MALTTVPNNIRVPFVYVAIDPSRAVSGGGPLKYTALIIGQKTSTGTVPALKTTLVRNKDEAGLYFGYGSQLHRMLKSWFANNKMTSVKAIALADLPAGVAAQFTITVTGTATADGIANLMLNGSPVKVGVLTGDTPTIVASAMVTAINANIDLPFTAASALGVVTLTSKNPGQSSDELSVTYNYNDGESLPAGVTLAVLKSRAGTGNPDVNNVIDAIGDQWFQVFVMPYNDDANLTAMHNELDDRFGPIRMLDGWCYTAKRGALGVLTTFSTNKNSQYISCMDANGIPASVEEFASARAAQEAASLENDPAVPVKTLALVGILPPLLSERRTWVDNNSLLYSGISTFDVDAGNNVIIQQSITMYRKNSAGAPDTAFYKVNTLATVAFLRYDFRNYFLLHYPRAKLADDGGYIPSGQQYLTPKTGKAEAINIFKHWMIDLGIVENLPQFKQDLVVRIGDNKDRIEFLLAPNLVNQADIITAIIQYIV